MKDAVGPGEAARRLGVSTRTVQRWLREGRLPSVQVGSHVKVDATALPADASGSNDARRPIERLLVANRGELVVRIARTCRQLGVTSLALVTEDQSRAWWVGAADEIVPLRSTYLDADAVLAAAIAARADAIHPGYGFLAENAAFAAAVEAAGIAWVGPPPDAMRALGDKAAARAIAARIGVPILPGYDGAEQSDRRLAREARAIGFPVLIKPSAGGGGKGMHVVEAERELGEALARARREAAAAFGDDRLILERYLARPRHVEIQFLRDAAGNAVHLGERECSLQRRHQKVIEEGPSPVVGKRLRAKLGDAALRLAEAAGYVGAGTAEFLLTAEGEFYFLEVNARLQVEHPVTELLTGRDLVADQLSIAAGEPLDFGQSDVSLTGHAIEARLYAEDPWHDFLPATGEIIETRWPLAEGTRVDAGVGADDVIGTRYDPLLAKVIVHAESRADAVRQLDDALAATSVLGVTTNRGFLRWLLAQPDVAGGDLSTNFIDQTWRAPASVPDAAWAAASSALAAHLGGRFPRLGFRLNSAPSVAIELDNEIRTVALERSAASVSWAAVSDESIVIDFDGQAIVAQLASAPTVEAAVRTASHAGATAAGIEAPMPGTVLSIRVAVGDIVEAGQVLMVLEAMKMENNVTAPAAGRVESIAVAPGGQVRRGETLVVLA